MKEWKSVDDVLDFAIGEEEAAEKFYTELSGQMKSPALRDTFLSFAQEEKGHKAKLVGIKQGKIAGAAPSEKVTDLKIADYLIDVEPDPKMNYQDALIVAMKKEKAAYKLYSDLAASVDDENLRNTFRALAQEEAKHKLRFEVEYDDEVLRHN